MSTYAHGKHSIAICDRCGQKYKYKQLKEEWTQFKVCPSCFDTKHPQLGPFSVHSDPQALYKPRPEPRDAVIQTVGDQFTFPPWLGGNLQTMLLAGDVTVTIS